ncbi:MAG: META domain-containing protein [Opitutales bacterium]|nr:META domain-containing protein [Opitutales bacterium]
MKKRTLALLSAFLSGTLLMTGCNERAPDPADGMAPPTEISASAEAGTRLAGTQWQIHSVEGVSLPETMRRPYLRFDTEGTRLSGFSGVNRLSGSYSELGDRIRLGNLAGTKMAGPPEAMAFEIAFMQMLRGDITWKIEDDQLTLTTDNGHTIELTAVPYDE